MRKIVVNGYISGLSDLAGEAITQEEYNDILAAMREKPEPRLGFAYKLNDKSLIWDMYELPPTPDVPTVEDKAEAYDILMGVSE